MENFLFALNTVLPFLLYIAFGYGVRMSGLADEDFMKRLNKVIFQAFFPILMFNNLYSIPEGMTLNLRLVAAAIISVLLLQAVLLAVVPRLVKENECVCGAIGCRKENLLKIEAGAVIMATGGCGQAFARNMNPVDITGDGYAMA